MLRISEYIPAREISAQSVATIAACSKRSCPTRERTPRASIDAGPRSTTRMTNSIRSAANYSNRKRWSFSSPSDGDRRTACINASSNALAGSRTELSSLGEKPIPQLKKLEAGIVLFGHNWNDEQVLQTQKQNFEWFGWKAPEALSFKWQYTKDADEESPASYSDAVAEFGVLLRLALPR